ncbi:restriction endonuclease subunit S [Rhizorhabdus sp. FW153]|uniref:restriction endonuclease subunit S n=1 Tax=Rhizorhabdus sp. FW153 TaxID=3400216 RepID=UPI003CF155E7
MDAGPVEGPWALPDGWRWERLGNLVEKSSAKYQPDEDSRLPFVGLEHIPPHEMRIESIGSFADMRSAGSAFVPGDVLYGRLRPYLNKVWVADRAGACSGELLVLRPKAGMDARYVALNLHSQRYVHYASHIVTGDRPRIDFDVVGAFPVPVPDEGTQQQVVACIDALFAEIDEGEAALAEARAGVETYRKALLKAAVTGELTADWRAANPSQETGEQLLASILGDRRARGHVIKKSQAGDLVAEDDLPILPDSWIWCRNEQAGAIQLGRQRTPKDHDGPHMRPYLRVANVYEERIDLRDVKQMNFTPSEFETFELKPGDILLNEGQSLELVGRPAMFRGEVEGCCFQNTLVRFRAGPHVDEEYALLTFLYAMHTKRFQRIAKITTNIAHLGAGRFAEIGFPLPPLVEQREVVRLYRAHMTRFAEAISTLSDTSALRQSILAAAFRGELVT